MGRARQKYVHRFLSHFNCFFVISIYVASDIAWLGGKKCKSCMSDLIWAVSSKPIVYRNWASGQPDNAGNNEDCIELRRSLGWTWNDITCSANNAYICESRCCC